jgi:phosphohistidine swiveling domain-containing protein
VTPATIRRSFARTCSSSSARSGPAFEQKDVATLERLLGPCVSQGVVPGGGASEPRESFIAELRQQLAAGIAIAVDASAIGTASEPNTSHVWSKWSEVVAVGDSAGEGSAASCGGRSRAATRTTAREANVIARATGVRDARITSWSACVGVVRPWPVVVRFVEAGQQILRRGCQTYTLDAPILLG